MLPPAYADDMRDQTSYRATVRCWDEGWELHVEGIGVTQVKDLRDARPQARDFIETVMGQEITIDSVELDAIHP